MRLLKFRSLVDEQSDLETDRLVARRPAPEHFKSWAAEREASEHFLRPWEPAWTSDELSFGAFRARLKQQAADITSGRGQHWLLFRREAPTVVVGGIALTSIKRGVSQSGTLGYWLSEKHGGQGLMSEAVDSVCRHAFIALELNRVQAGTVLDNHRSQRLLERCYFKREGVARAYLKINNVWQDHIIYARLQNDSI